MQAFAKRFGRKAGRRAWLDFRAKNDPEAPTTVAQAFPYETTSAFAKRGLAIPDPGSVVPTPTDGAPLRREPGARPRRDRLGRRALRRALAGAARLELGAGLGP